MTSATVLFEKARGQLERERERKLGHHRELFVDIDGVIKELNTVKSSALHGHRRLEQRLN
jgi:hypothetical protein